jgi:cytochrome P450
MRFEPPVRSPSQFEMLEDAKAGGYYFKKGDVVLF